MQFEAGQGLRASGEISIQFRKWELKSPDNLLINRALNVVVMGTTVNYT